MELLLSFFLGLLLSQELSRFKDVQDMKKVGEYHLTMQRGAR